MPQMDKDRKKVKMQDKSNPIQQLAQKLTEAAVHPEQGPVPTPVNPVTSPVPQPPAPAAQPEVPVEQPSQQESLPDQPLPESPPISQEPPWVDPPSPTPTSLSTEQMQMPAAQSLVLQLANHNRGQSQKFHLVIIPDDDHPCVRTYDVIEDMIADMQQYFDTPTSLFPVMGDLLQISKGPNRYLVTPFGNLPLFALPGSGELEFENDGFVGEPVKELVVPASETVDDDDDADDDDDDEASEAVTPAIAAPADEQDTPVLPPAE